MNVPWYVQPYGAPTYPSAPLSQHPHLAHGVGIATTQPPLWGYMVPPPIPVLHAIETRNCDNGTSPANEAQDHGNCRERVEGDAAMASTEALEPAKKKYPNQEITEGGE